MPSLSPQHPVYSRSPTARIFTAAAIVAILDFSWAALVWVVVLKTTTLMQLPQSIAKGLLGSEAAYSGGYRTAILGLLLHCTIALGWTLVYYAAVHYAPRLRRIVRTNAGMLRIGLIYGALVWVAMTLVVMPISRIGATSIFEWLWLINLGQQALMVGLPIVLIVREG